MYKPNIRVKFIWRLYRVRNTIKLKEGRTLSLTDMVEEALSEYLYRIDTECRALPEAKIKGTWYYLDDRADKRLKVPPGEKRLND